MRQGRVLLAELIGTMVLVIGGPGTAILATGGFTDGSVEVLGVSLAFGFSLLVMAYAIGNISGCHINPAVTFALWIARRVETAMVPIYVAGQLVGAALGGLVIYVIASGGPGDFDANETTFAVNGWADLSPGGFNFGAMLVTEIVMTAILAFVVLSTAHRRFAPAASGLAVGITLALIHLVSIPVDNTSVNPARSFGVAIFAGADAMEQLWAFIIFPLVGAALGAVAWALLDDSREIGVAETTAGDDALLEVPQGPGADVAPTAATSSDAMRSQPTT
jgi:aquaporin Z